MKSAIMLIVALQALGSIRPVLGGHHGKRMVWGQPLFNYDAYSVIGYYTFIADGSFFSFNLVRALAKVAPGVFSQPTIQPTSLRCGGALLTPTIVFTACHCHVEYVKLNETYSRAQLSSTWEHWGMVFVGWTMVHEIKEKDGSLVKFTVAHQKCARIRGAAVFDFGLIVLKDPVRLRLPHMKPAPVHRAIDIANQYLSSLSKEHVCLYVGFGRYYYVDKQKGTSGTPSPVLQHGWRAFRSHYQCLKESYPVFHNSPFRISDYLTWLCTSFFGKQRAAMMRGDSGGPVTCTEVRVGLVSQGSELPDPISRESVGAIAFDMEDNAAEYRQSLENYLRERSKDQSDLRPTRDYTILPPGYTLGKLNPILNFDKSDPFPFNNEASTGWVSTGSLPVPLFLVYSFWPTSH